MKLLDRLERYANEKENVIAFYNSFTKDKLTYYELKIKSDCLANEISEAVLGDKSPIIVYGHKEKEMLIAFIACVKAGHPYCPIDTSVPKERIRKIVKESKAKYMIALEKFDGINIRMISLDRVIKICDRTKKVTDNKSLWLRDDDTFYVIFTSGSTGVPKGVEISCEALNNYLVWMEHINNHAGYFDGKNIFLNQAPFSFDLSVMDTFVSLYTGGTIWSLDHRVQNDYGLLYERLKDSEISVWVSTPSFANMCLMNRQFNDQMMRKLKLFLFCGEVLSKKTATELQERFPNSVIINTYGPTESTVAVTEVEVTRQLIKEESEIPIGVPKNGTEIFIVDENNSIILEDNEKGELFITGNTLSKGYLNRPDLTSEKFVSLKYKNREIYGYKTGDIGFRKNNLLYYCGRKDFQVKINGYRIELGDVEKNILKSNRVLDCAVIPLKKDDVLNGLAAFVKVEGDVEDEFVFTQQLREELGMYLPRYMIPRKYIFLDEMKMTNNGKIDRKYLESFL